MDIDAWKSHVAIPHLLNALVQVVKGGEAVVGGRRVSQEQLEEILPHLCLAQPSCSLVCADLLHSLPCDSSVWGTLEAALISKKVLQRDITSALYLRHCPALEREVLRVLELYVGVESQSPWWHDERLNISHFKPHGRPLRADPPAKQHSEAGTADGCKVNVWADSPLVEASGHTTQLFTHCLELLGNVLWKTHFSFCAIIACRDFLAQDQDDLRRSSLLPLVRKGLLEELAEGGETARGKVCVMLCFFPFWLPPLRKCGFLKKYLADTICDIF
ncbi:uncharacterized protein LOC123512682 isoform X2 [Portunus trituberculatus]|uniref:uncharacterized protein LOC123512682 isoform X2 n=1 Tax=Portunus trituberculatus TaxID=210409 RepID=UPI001E1D09C6|nr:uncharacterized protein LOC123512682 isoform X2 [Portunus trituberculatus]